MIKQNITNKILLIHLKESNLFRFLGPAENINVNEEFEVYKKTDKESTLKELKRIKKIRTKI